MSESVTNRHRASKSGMTLMEVMIAFSILTLVLFAFLSSFGMGKKAEVQGTATMEGMHYGRSIIEQLRALNYSDSQLSYGTHSISSGQYVVTSTSGFASTKDIHMTVWWTDPGTARTSTVTLATSISGALHD